MAESKSDIMVREGERMSFSAQTGDGMDALKERVLKELREVFRRKAVEADLEEPERWPGRSRRAPRWRSTSPV